MKHDVAGKAGLDPTLPTVVLKLGGVQRTLRYDFNAIAQAAAVTGVNLLYAEVRDINPVSLRGLLWAALLPEDPDIELLEVGKLINPMNIGVIHEALIAAWYGSIEESKPAKEGASGEAEARPKRRA